MSIVKAQAWMEGRKVAADDDLEILSSALWEEPEQRAQVRQVIMEMANPFDSALIYMIGLEVYQKAMEAEEEATIGVGTEANAKLKRIANQLAALEKRAAEAGKDTARIGDIRERITSWNKEVISRCLGIQI